MAVQHTCCTTLAMLTLNIYQYLNVIVRYY